MQFRLVNGGQLPIIAPSSRDAESTQTSATQLCGI